MDFLQRENSPLTEKQWQQIDLTVIETAKKVLVGRRFLSIFGPLGAQTQTIAADIYEIADTLEPKRKYLPLKMLYEDFELLWNDLEYSKKNLLPLDMSKVSYAAQNCAKKEDELIFWGCNELGLEGIMTAKGVNRLQKSDWKTGENAYVDVAKGVEMLLQKGYVGSFVLVMSPDLFVQLQRIQPSTGMLEYERIRKFLDGNVYKTPVLGNDRAVLLSSDPSSIDLVIGQDMITAYAGNNKLDHEFRIFETVVLRIKRKDSIVIFE
ncbi:family 1 encapsulin nanocompartment shell protein [Caldicellulosiruptor morganii]|uniref:Type 1 encapsulin shell protein n=1 Tax=Caldicellulosiruptor morganii TaxID=1387555 RepID=A0ABY7BNQ1_9FIRM|nr:family 1 encapsulin nanocompartment shell protein [Caldicellulosiruptor morganii]WAM34063.1 bacteriocin family protein [Caldicellulosiruptor morganii]